MIVKTITDGYYFWNWLKNSSYKDNFSLEGALNVQSYYDEVSDDLGEPIEFDPIAWCCDFNEYQTLNEAYEEYEPDDATAVPDAEKLEYFQDRAPVIELDGGGIIIGVF